MSVGGLSPTIMNLLNSDSGMLCCYLMIFTICGLGLPVMVFSQIRPVPLVLMRVASTEAISEPLPGNLLLSLLLPKPSSLVTIHCPVFYI